MDDLFEYQQDFVKYLSLTNNIGIMAWARQSGKTYTALYEACRNMVESGHYEVHLYVYGPSRIMMAEVVMEILKRMLKSHMIKSHNLYMIRLTNDSEIHFLNITTKDSLRGDVVDLIIVDNVEGSVLLIDEILDYKNHIKSDAKVILTLSQHNERLYEKIKNYYHDINKFFIHEYKLN